MVKSMYLMTGETGESRPEFAERVRQLVLQTQGDQRIIALKYTVTDMPLPTLSVIPFAKPLLASISVYEDDYRPARHLIGASGFRGCYRVQEVYPIAYEKTWADGEVTPGVNLVTLFRKRPDIDYKTFIDRWHNGHTPLSLKIHPMWNYSRNVVDGDHSEGPEEFDGIVEEHFRTRADLLNPFRFFGDVLNIVPNMWKVYDDVKGFIDYPTIETYLASEYHIRSISA